MSLSKEEFQSYISSQLNHFFPDKNLVRLSNYSPVFDLAIDRLHYCFQRVAYSRYNKDGETILNHLYADQYMVFTWFLSNSIWKETGDVQLSSKLYYLNKSLHAFDCMYDTGLPDIFLIFHGAGTMLGKATYADYFVSLQGCTIGSHKGIYPVIGKGVALTAHSSIVGDCHVGDRVSISIHTSVFGTNVPSDTTVFTDVSSGNTVFKPSKVPYSQQFFNVDLQTV